MLTIQGKLSELVSQVNAMTAILFGSIGTIADTSELQRQAFNQAFAAHGLDWHWDRESYMAMLEGSGGQQRIADYAQSMGQTVDAAAIHRTKSALFQDSLTDAQISPRPGVVETIQNAKNAGVKLAFVTTTSQTNISQLFNALAPEIEPTDFAVITNADSVERSKPDADAYLFALEALGEPAAEGIAIEDNLGGLAAAASAGLSCVAFPNENTAHHDFSMVPWVVDHLDFQQLQGFVDMSSQAHQVAVL
jgi:HAD superfamily hydrolase (TIGR01509 family)